VHLPLHRRDHRDEERHPRRFDLVECHHERVLTGRGERQVKYQDCRGFKFGHACRRFIDLHHAGLLERHIASGIEKLHAQFVCTELGTPTAEMQHEVCPGMHRRELLYRDMAPDAEHGKLATLVEQGVIAEQREIATQRQLTRMERTTSPCLIALTTSMPLVT
jgi:hypothetical protein